MNLISLLTMHEYIVFLRFIILNIFLYIFFNYNIILNNLAANVFLGNILFLVFYFIYCLFLETEFCREDLKVMKMKIENKALLLSFIALCSSCINYSIYVKSNSFYLYYISECPFKLQDINYELHLEKRCELYNINMNQSYPYQYICSFNPEKAIQKSLFFFQIIALKKNLNIMPMNCSEVKILKQNNKVIDNFVNEYYKEDIYYCDLKNLPNIFPNADFKCCNKYNINIFIIYILSTYFFITYVKTLFCYFTMINSNINIS